MYPKILRIECADKTCFRRLGHIIIDMGKPFKRYALKLIALKACGRSLIRLHARMQCNW